jgi:transposase
VLSVVWLLTLTPLKRAAVDHNGELLGVESFPADRAGYEELLGRLVGFGEVEQIGVEGTGSWGVGLTRFLHDQKIIVVAVDRPNRQKRRKEEKSDPMGSNDRVANLTTLTFPSRLSTGAVMCDAV